MKFQHRKDVDSLLRQLSQLQIPSNLSTKSENTDKHSDSISSSNLKSSVVRTENITEKLASNSISKLTDSFEFRPIGYVESCHASKNGSPRQPTVSPDSRGIINIKNMSTFSAKLTNVEYSLQNLEDFSHVWIIFVFHQNEENFVKTKVNYTPTSKRPFINAPTC